MSGRSSYPSPLSSTTSPPMNDDVAPATSPRIVTEPAVRDHTETHRSLQQASAALETAYRRIRQVRRNLLEMTETHTPSQRRGQGTSDIGPSHEAITLIGGLGVDPVGEDDDSQNALSPVYSTFEERLRQFEATIQSDLQRRSERYRELPPVTPSPVHPTPSSNPMAIRRPHILPRRSQLESQFTRRREITMDDAATSLGRRVAARQAVGSLNSQPTTASPPRSTLGFEESNSAQLVATIERDLERFQSFSRQRRSEPAPATLPEDTVLPDFSRTSRTVDTNPASRLTHPHSLVMGANSSRTSSLVPQQESRRRRLFSPNSSISNQSERLSLLSNFSVQNLTTPVSAGIPRPLLFDEPASYIPAANFTQQYPADGVEPVEDISDERNYIIRRRLNADGEEHVHPINLDWLRLDEDAQSWLMPRDPNDDSMPFADRPVYNRPQRRDTIQPASNGGMSASPAGPPRRRGWARLDPDGNEIPSDEEDELERTRAEYRVQAQSGPRPPGSLFGAGIDTRPSLLHSLHAPTTSTSLPPDDDADLNADAIPRVRLNARDSPAFSGSVMDSVIAVDTLRRDVLPAVHSSPVLPFCSYPLPMPLEDMVWSAPKTRALRVVRVHEYASLAGR